MRINFADTISMYFTFPLATNTIGTLPKPWRYKKSTNIYKAYWFIQQQNSFLCFYPDIYGRVRLFMTYSVPRVLTGSNAFNTADFDEYMFYQLINKDLDVFPWNSPPFNTIKRPISFTEWEASRMDLFIMHPIPVGEREDYMDAYTLFTLPRYRSVKYKNTYYINSSVRPDRKANKVLRFYPKVKEMYDTLDSVYPAAVHRVHEQYLQMNESMTDYIRFEGMLRRSILTYECQQRKISTTVHDVFNQSFQEELLFKLIDAVGLNRKILSRREFVQQAKLIFKTDKTYQNALLYARCVRNKQSCTLSRNQIQLIKRTLRSNNLHFVTHRYISLLPVNFK